jgi:enoyl-[acyl-carrier protein] reductase I
MRALLEGKTVVVMGVANERSIAWAVSRAVAAHGGRLILTYQGQRLLSRLRKLASQLDEAAREGPKAATTSGAPVVPIIECDVTDDDAVRAAFDEIGGLAPQVHGLVHSIAWAPAEDLQGRFVSTTRAGFAAANDVSAYSLVAVARGAQRLLAPDASIVTMTYAGSQRVLPNYNVMGPAKASLEACVRYLAADLGPEGVRVNAVSAGPIHTVAARTIKDFDTILHLLEERTPLRRNVTAEEVADVTVFLLSDLARAVTGEIVHVDSGAHTLS